MIAELRAFGNMDMNDANIHLKENLKVVKEQAEALLHNMDLTAGRISFEEGEIDKWIALRDAILNFRTLEVNPNLAQNVMISVDNMDKLHDVFGAYTESAVNRVINDLICEADKKIQGKIISQGKLQKALDKIEAKNKALEEGH